MISFFFQFPGQTWAHSDLTLKLDRTSRGIRKPSELNSELDEEWNFHRQIAEVRIAKLLSRRDKNYRMGDFNHKVFRFALKIKNRSWVHLLVSDHSSALWAWMKRQESSPAIPAQKSFHLLTGWRCSCLWNTAKPDKYSQNLSSRCLPREFQFAQRCFQFQTLHPQQHV